MEALIGQLLAYALIIWGITRLIKRWRKKP